MKDRIYKVNINAYQPSYPGCDQHDEQEIGLEEKCFASAKACAQYVRWFLNLRTDETWVDCLGGGIAQDGALLNYGPKSLEGVPALSGFKRVEISVQPVEFELGEFTPPEKHWSEGI